MAASISFVADFSNFNQALDRATLKLRDFGLEPAKVEKALNRIGESFSGQKIISDATLATRAINDMGGASKLTADEQKRVNTMVTEAIAKYAALGKTAPPELLAIAKATERVGTETTKVKSPMSEVLGIVGKLGPAIGLSFSVGSIIAFAKSIGTFAGNMVDLQAQTRISTDRLQAFNYVGAGSGLTIDDIASSADQLAKRIGDGDKSAVGALAQLNIKVDEFRRLSLDDAMLLIDDRLAGVANQFDQANIKADLFGRSGMKLGRIFDGNLRQVIKAAEESGAVIDKELIKKADDFDDAWAQAWIRFKAGAVTAVGAVIDGVQKLDTALGQAKTKAEEFEDIAARIRARQGIPDLPGAPGLPQLPALGLVQNPATQAEIAAITKQSEALAANLKKQEEFKASMVEMTKATKAFLSEANNAEGLKRMNQDLDVLQASASKATKELQKLGIAAQTPGVTSQLWNQGGGLLGGLMQGGPANLKSQNVSAGKASGVDFFSGFTGGFKDLWAGMSGGKGIGGMLSGVGAGISQGFGNLISGGLTSLISGGISLLGKGISSLFGKLTGGEGKKVNDLRDAAFAAAGGFDKLNEKAHLAGTTLDDVLDARKVKDYDAAWQDLQDTLSEYEADQERLQAAIEKYGFTIEQLGPTLQKQELDKQAKELIEDWRVLVAAGIDMATVNEKMAETISQYLQTAIKVGSEVPAAMRPILQSMIDQGTLVDANGQAITDLEKAGVSFSETMTEGFDRVVKKLDELIDRLQGAGAAIENIPSSIPINVEYNDPGYSAWQGKPDTDMLPAFASGTRGRFLDFGGGTPVLLHGRERVMTEAEGRNQGGGALETIASALDGIDRRISTAVSRAVTDALILAPGWR